VGGRGFGGVFLAACAAAFSLLGTGVAAAAPPAGYTVVTDSSLPVSGGGGTWGLADVVCPAGTVVLGGGEVQIPENVNAGTIESYPANSST
jgi:hypothetical protein